MPAHFYILYYNHTLYNFFCIPNVDDQIADFIILNFVSFSFCIIVLNNFQTIWESKIFKNYYYLCVQLMMVQYE